MERYDYVVVGAGPAGLAFASSAKNANVLVVDSGKEVSQRDRFNPKECVQGAGGAGLFSDGKFSFYPAGTEIWNQDLWRLREAYHLLESDLSPFGSIPQFPRVSPIDNSIQDSSGWDLKSYPSIYFSLKHRVQLIQKLAERCSNIYYQTEFLEYTKVPEGFIVQLKDISSEKVYSIKTQKLVLAGGRFMPLFLNIPKRFLRYEFGFRIKGPTHLIQKKVNLTDPKYVFSSAAAEYRTFCWCENGEVIKTSFNGIETFSGRADCPPTGMNNFGFNIRIKNPRQMTEENFRKLISMAPYEIDMPQFIKNLPSPFDSETGSLVDYGCAQLLEKFPELFCKEVSVMGPTIEGVGYYPNINDVFVIGDCNGTYRGIVPGMMAGYLLAVGEKVSSHKVEDENTVLPELFVTTL
jgi:uncharacterized FAD-dependent dehydrogenase